VESQQATISSVGRASVRFTEGPEIVPRIVRIIFGVFHRLIHI